MSSKQREITSFFCSKPKPPTTPKAEEKLEKRKLAINDENVENEPKNKVAKEDLVHEQSCLSPDQKSRMDKNKTLALIKVTAKKIPHVMNENMGASWYKALQGQLSKPYIENLNSFLEKERNSNVKIFPPHDQVWSWTQHFALEDTKVVILGQDPYHGPGQAHGLCFSVQRGVKPPPSLINMYKELANDIEGFQIPNHGCLTGWAKQGVLLLNACLTVRQGQANSHKDKGWETLTTAVVKAISDKCDGVVFLLWGSYAQKKADLVDKKKHHLLKTVHPSPLSAHRGFLGSGHFSKCNNILIQQGKAPIDWKALND